MHVDLQAVCRVFEDVLNGSMSREQADRWAHAVVHEEETGVVTYSPPGDRERIWAGVMYLYGVDAMKAPGVYLHSERDISAAMDAKLGEVSEGTAAVPVRTLDQWPSQRLARRIDDHRRFAQFAQVADMSSGGAILSGSGLT